MVFSFAQGNRNNAERVGEGLPLGKYGFHRGWRRFLFARRRCVCGGSRSEKRDRTTQNRGGGERGELGKEGVVGYKVDGEKVVSKPEG